MKELHITVRRKFVPSPPEAQRARRQRVVAILQRYLPELLTEPDSEATIKSEAAVSEEVAR